MSIYYQDDLVTLYHGDSLEILPTLDIAADALLTDPPYFKVKQEEWDNQWDKAAEFLGWMGDFLDLAKPLLTAQASVWVFASPAMTSSVERLVGERFRVLNSVRWVKEAGWHQKAEIAALRSYLTPWEGVVFAEQFEDPYEVASKALHKDVFAPLGRYFKDERERAGWGRSDLEVALGYASRTDPTRGTALYTRWEEGSSLPTEETYGRIQATLGAGFLVKSYADLQRESETLRREFEKRRESIELLRRPFTIDQRLRSTDVWNFAPVATFPGKHPCEKPESMLRHMIEASSRPGALILDPFAGSGSTLLAASRADRRAVGIEKDERWCEHAANRLSQGTLDIFGDAA